MLEEKVVVGRAKAEDPMLDVVLLVDLVTDFG